jgi:regulator of ribosome biosynthesis
MYRHGMEKANSKSKEWPIMEVGANDDPYSDPWEKLRDEKRERTDKNVESRMRNQERVGNLAKGITNRVMKAKTTSREMGRVSGGNVLPTGVPVDLKSGSGEAQKRGKVSTTAALEAVQTSTASMGKFDQMREGEPERKKAMLKKKKRKFESGTSKSYHSVEGEKSMKILNAVMNGGGVAKEKDIRKGKYAKGETAYDYEFDDGLGASSFKKKKGRAGAGKNKKMTKKRIK